MWWPWKRKKYEDVYLTSTEILHILKPWGITSIELADRKWRLLPDSKFKEVAIESGVREREYQKDIYDCDNFAHSLVEAFNGLGYLFGICSGRIVSGPHRWNFYINEKKQIRFIEPQTYKRYSDKDIISIMFFYTI